MIDFAHISPPAIARVEAVVEHGTGHQLIQSVVEFLQTYHEVRLVQAPTALVYETGLRHQVLACIELFDECVSRLWAIALASLAVVVVTGRDHGAIESPTL